MADQDRRGVFISWSKTASAKIAKHLQPFLEDVLGTATVFMSQAMEGGSRWAMEIPQHLETCNAGLLLVTRENRHEPWLHFEAGALSKHIDEARVVPLLCGAAVGDIQGTPLSMFQAKNFDHDDFLSVCLSFGTAFGVPDESVRRRFEKSWPELERAVVPITRETAKPEKELGLSDIMAVMERLAGQVGGIEAALKSGTVPIADALRLRPWLSGQITDLGEFSSRRLQTRLDDPFCNTENTVSRALLEYLILRDNKLSPAERASPSVADDQSRPKGSAKSKPPAKPEGKRT